jgi:hypothetical protein
MAQFHRPEMNLTRLIRRFSTREQVIGLIINPPHPMPLLSLAGK